MENLTLTELTGKIRKALSENLEYTYNVVGEISEISMAGGHAYLELIEKDKKDKTVAKIRAIIWASTNRIIQAYFKTSTGHDLRAGLKILVQVSVDFSEIYGLSLNIKDIDPVYTLGDIERKRLEILNQLESEGVMKMNKELDLPIVIQKIAVISSSKAAGYEDFIDQIANNRFGYHFEIELFEAIMQGESAANSIIAAMDNIFGSEKDFDAVVIIRGGGSKSDLSCFDSYDLALNICQFPLPVITGIGHERDESISDLVANTSLKTPTAVAEFLIGNLNELDVELDERLLYLNEFISDFVNSQNEQLNSVQQKLEFQVKNTFLRENAILENKTLILSGKTKLFVTKNFTALENIERFIIPNITKNIIIKQKNDLNLINSKLESCVNNIMKKHFHNLEILDYKTEAINPINVLKKGYSLTLINSIPVKDSKDIKKGDIIKTIVASGEFKSSVL